VANSRCQYLNFCTSKASKLSSGFLSHFLEGLNCGKLKVSVFVLCTSKASNLSFTGTKVQILTPVATSLVLFLEPPRRGLVKLSFLLYWYKSTNTDTCGDLSRALPGTAKKRTSKAQFTCFTGTKVEILTRVATSLVLFLEPPRR
jgi:hypothetical protein